MMRITQKSTKLKTLLLIFTLLPLMLLSDQAGPFAAKKKKKGFIVGDLFGQLGNQMFQIAAATSYALDHNLEAYFPDLANSEKFGIPVNAKKVFYRLNSSDPPHPFYVTYREPAFTYTPIKAKNRNLRIHGYFQSWKYFDHHKMHIQKLFEPHPEIISYLQEKYPHIVNDPKSVAVHIRTYHVAGDDPNHLVFALNGEEYVSKAVTIFPDDYHFYVFSDDIPWCKSHLSNIPKNFEYIEGNHYLHDFYLQTLCKHNIISNSSFSWWAAYLNLNPEKIVVAPGQWFQPEAKGLSSQDLLPKSWIVVYP